MAAVDYPPALARLLVHEGGYTNHPKDPGGPTNFGITIGDYRRYVKSDATAEDVKNMRVAEAKAIYKTKYWAALNCDALPPGVDDVVFDYGVNSGIGRAGKVLRRCLDLPDNDWQVTSAVAAAADKVNPKQLIADICDERMRFLRSLKTWPTFGGGWGTRVKELRAFDLALVDHPGNSPIDPRTSPGSAGKGRVTVPPGSQPATSSGLATVGAAITQWLHDGGHSPAVVGIAIGITILVAVIGWMAWHGWAKRQQEAPA